MTNKIYAAIANSTSKELHDFVVDVFGDLSIARHVGGASYEDISAGDFMDYLVEISSDHMMQNQPKGADE